MSFRHTGAFLFLILVAVPVAHAQLVVESVFHPTNNANYGDPNNWSPPEVPNNSPDKIYHVTIHSSVRMNVDATISTLDFDGGYTSEDHSLIVLDHTNLNNPQIFLATTVPAEAKLSFGSIDNLSDGLLTGTYYLSNYNTAAGSATLQIAAPDITALSHASLSLVGPMTRFVDAAGNDGLTHLTHIDKQSSLQMVGHQLVVPGPFTNLGLLSLGSGFDQPGQFTIAGSLTNFDPETRTLTSGSYSLGGNNVAGSNHPTVFQFNGADIVNNAATITLADPFSRILDENGANGLRNFSRNAATGVLSVGYDFNTVGDFTNDGELSVWFGTFTVSGKFTNFAPVTRTLTGGKYQIGSRLAFEGADIVNNAASIDLSYGASITDKNGNDALRNFASNLPTGELNVSDNSIFTVATDFTNAGVANIISSYPMYRPANLFSLSGSHHYRQTSGSTYFAYCQFAGDMVIDGGLFSTAPSNAFYPPPAELEGNLEIGSAIFEPRHFTVHGSVHLSSDSHFRITPHGWSDGIFQVDGTFTAAGALEIESITPPPSDSEGFAVVTAGVGVIGTFNNAPNGARIPTIDGLGSFVVSYGLNGIGLSHYQALPAIPRLLNISTRAQVGATESVLVGGFIIGGTQPTRILVRALGPSLGSLLPGVLADPRLELHDSSGDLIASNDNWRSDQEQEIIATGIPPPNDLESAIVATLPANNSAYTAVVRGGNDTSGIGVVELYDLDRAIDSKPINISTRGQVRPEEEALIGGFIALGQTSFRVIIRAIGPSLLVAGSLTDPTLNLYDGNGALIASNDNWRSDQEAEIVATGIPPANDLESAIVATLPGVGGSYTSVVQSKNGASGIALVEVYDLNH